MRMRGLMMLSAVTAVTVLAAVWIQASRLATGRAAQGGDLMFPKLAERINDARTIKVATKDGGFTVAKGEGGWSVTQKSGYPASFESVKMVLLVLSELETVEAKTKIAERHKRIEVEDVAAKDAQSKQVTVADAAGTQLAALIVGKRRFTRGIGGAAMFYVRKPGEAQSWLAKGDLDISGEATGWMDRTIVNVRPSRIREYTVSRADGGRVVIRKEKPGDQDFALANLPDGAKVKSASKIDTIARALMGLDLDDVRAASEIDFTGQAKGGAEMRTFDGLVVTVRLAKAGDEAWLAFKASHDESARWAREDEAAKAKDAGGDAADGDAKDSDLKSKDEVRQEVEAINARVAGWAYRVGKHRLSDFEAKLDDMIEKKKPS